MAAVPADRIIVGPSFQPVKKWRLISCKLTRRNRHLILGEATGMRLYLLIFNRTEFRLVQDQSANGKYYLILVELTRIRYRFLCANMRQVMR